MASVRKVKASHVHARLNCFFQIFLITCRWANSGHNLRSTIC
ncbi:Hypothetical protein Bdt_2061 [Bdellovibrio bacteriovorus str. Tiberius]|uniref:Uncharacterized protein n=1 Tax=Bdellovibrio bacteriovorus str. Tiberius TaxID=1069642 RepID=K7ZFR1_BDEBC|nr:Hypothetical protein Bdt_2061 [Bdellovibrio bacteriovorus str. Tiberius]